MKLIIDESSLEKRVFFPVKMKCQPTVELEPGLIVQPKQTYVYNGNNGDIFYHGTDRYGLLKHEDFLGKIEKNLANRGFHDFAWGPDMTKEEKSEIPHREIFADKDGGTIRARFFLPTKENVGNNNKDEIGICLDSWNSITGKKSEKMQMGAFRFVCSNGMIGFNDSVSFSKKHTGGNFGEDLGDMILDKQFDALWGDYGKDLEVYRNMDSQVITKDQLESIIKSLPVGNPEKQRKNNHFDGIRDRFWISEFDTDRRDRSEHTLWDLYNATTEHITHTVEKENGKVDLAHRMQEKVTPFFKNLSDGLRAQKPLVELLA
jgi:hypothetical protein